MEDNINTSLLASKKFRTALWTAFANLLTFAVTKLGLGWNVDEILLLVSAITAPALMYILGESYSERDAKTELAAAKAKTDAATQVLDRILEEQKGGDEGETKA